MTDPYTGEDIMPAIGETRICPDCRRPQHYTGTEYGWAHDALADTWHCADPRKAEAPLKYTEADRAYDRDAFARDYGLREA